MNRLKKKLSSAAGETLAETLAGLTIAVLALTMLAGGILAAARLNRNAETYDSSFQTEAAAEKEITVTVEIDGSGRPAQVLTSAENENPDVGYEIHAYQTADCSQYTYYKVKKK